MANNAFRVMKKVKRHAMFHPPPNVPCISNCLNMNTGKRDDYALNPMEGAITTSVDVSGGARGNQQGPWPPYDMIHQAKFYV